MSENEDLKKQIAELKGKTEDEILRLMLKWCKNGQAGNFTKEDHAKIVEALDYAEEHGLSTRDALFEKTGCFKK